MTTGAPTLVGSFTGLVSSNDQMVGLAFDPDLGTLWGSTGGSHDPDRIYTIDKSSGAVTLVGTTGLTPGSTPDLAFDASAGLYGVKGGGQAVNRLISIDKGTAAGTEIGPINTDPNASLIKAVSGLACYFPPPPVPVLGERGLYLLGAAALLVLGFGLRSTRRRSSLS